MSIKHKRYAKYVHLLFSVTEGLDGQIITLESQLTEEWYCEMTYHDISLFSWRKTIARGWLLQDREAKIFAEKWKSRVKRERGETKNKMQIRRNWDMHFSYLGLKLTLYDSFISYFSPKYALHLYNYGVFFIYFIVKVLASHFLRAKKCQKPFLLSK